jgi:DHA2 family methylenomycin A resistance protein-like MFS transporter
VATGLVFVPMTGLTAFVTLLAPRAAARFGAWVPIAVGQVLMALGLVDVYGAVTAGAPSWRCRS